jgi:hypothetical protein
MSSLLSRAALLLAGASVLTGCHARWFPLATAPTYYFRTQSQDGTLNKVMEGTLTDNDAEYASGTKYAIPAPGSLLITAKPANPAAQLEINVFSDGSVPIATTSGNADKKLTVQDVVPGDIYVVVSESWKEAIKSKYKMTTIYKPANPDGANGVYKTQAGARELSPDKGNVSDTVDYSAMRRTNFWRITLTGDGGLIVKFSHEEGTHLSAEFISPSGAPEKIDPAVGIKKDELPSGDYYVKVTADDAGDAGKYTLTTTFKAGDVCKNGGPACTVDGAEDLKLPSDSKTGEVDFTKAKQAHYYKFTLKEKGKMSLNFKILQPPRGSKVVAYLLKSPDDDGEKISGSGFLRTLEPGEYYVRIIAPDAGDFAKYAMASIFAPDNFIGADVVEIGKNPCMLTVNAGTNQNVRQNATVTIVGGNAVAVDTGVIDQAFPNLSKVRPFNARTCNSLPPSGTKVQIAGQ